MLEVERTEFVSFLSVWRSGVMFGTVGNVVFRMVSPRLVKLIRS